MAIKRPGAKRPAPLGAGMKWRTDLDENLASRCKGGRVCPAKVGTGFANRAREDATPAEDFWGGPLPRRGEDARIRPEVRSAHLDRGGSTANPNRSGIEGDDRLWIAGGWLMRGLRFTCPPSQANPFLTVDGCSIVQSQCNTENVNTLTPFQHAEYATIIGRYETVRPKTVSYLSVLKRRRQLFSITRSPRHDISRNVR